MRNFIIAGLVLFLTLFTVVFFAGKYVGSIALEQDKEILKYRKNINKRVVIGKDTLTILDYSPEQGYYILSVDGVQVGVENALIIEP